MSKSNKKSDRLAYVFEQTTRIVIAADSYAGAYYAMTAPTLELGRGVRLQTNIVKIEFQEALPESVFIDPE